jgi:hypothetical protein
LSAVLSFVLQGINQKLVFQYRRITRFFILSLRIDLNQAFIPYMSWLLIPIIAFDRESSKVSNRA